ncbi:ATP-binding protein [Derxia gummosa]|uniref:Virulence sensor protein BvgS n=1 Tax=Derxia gummosa DSM 723 TaxID=1121388 RepID=A0A8B6XAP8_9BURK|nr:transporter substrate-binding domain-containing protein [Derxia gummosa]
MGSTRLKRLLPALLLAAGPALALAAPARIRVALDDNTPPYAFRGSDGELQGLVIDDWHLWEERTGVAVEFVPMPLGRSQPLLAAGKVDVIDEVFRTPAREDIFDFSPPYMDVPLSIYTHNSIGGITDTRGLHGFLVAARAGAACASDLIDAGVETVATYPTYDAMIAAAASGEVKVFCMDESSANFLLYRERLDQDYRLAFMMRLGRFHRVVAKGNEAMLELVNDGFARIPSEASHAVRERWLGRRLTPVYWLKAAVYGLAGLALAGIVLAVWTTTLRRRVRERTAELAREKAQLGTLIATIPDLVWLKDLDGRFLACNPEFGRRCGVAPEQIVGRTDFDLVPTAEARSYRERDLEVIAAGRPLTSEESVLHVADGDQRLLQTIKTPMRDADGQLIGVLGVSRDITALRRAEQDMRRSRRALEVLNACNRALVDEPDEAGLLAGLCRIVVELGGYGMAWVGMAGPAPERRIRLLARAGAGSDYLDGTELSWDAGHDSGRGPVGEALRGDRPHIDENLAREPVTEVWRARIVAAGMRSSVALPLAFEGERGVLSIHSREPEAFGVEEMALLTRLAADVAHGVSVLRARAARLAAEAELARHREHLADLVRVRTAALDQARADAEHARAEAERAREEAEQASRAKTRFLANMSHEIRTPMSAILGLTHLLRAQIGNGPPRQRLDQIAEAANRLLALINDILDISKIEAGKLALSCADFAPRVVAGQILRLMQAQTEARGLALQVEIDPALPDWLHGDALRLGQILLNFVSNAVKFTEHGGVTVKLLRIAPDAADDRLWLRLEVSDTGIGIAPEQLARLFRMFEQADASTTRRYGGTGLGLAISKRLAELMGGRIGADSQPDRGSRFWVELPFAPAFGAATIAGAAGGDLDLAAIAGRRDRDAEADNGASHDCAGNAPHPPADGACHATRPPDAGAAPLPAPTPPLAGLDLLLAEDNELNRLVATELLRQAGARVTVAEDGIVAVALAREHGFDAVLMDVQMPRLDGLGATRQIRRLPGRERLPIIAMTANAYAEDRASCLDAGMNDHVAKPFRPDELVATLLRWTSRDA